MNNPVFRPFLFSIADLTRMVDAGIFVGRTGRIELIEGELRSMSPASDGHDDLIRFLDKWSHQFVGENYFVAVQQGLRLLQTESMPEPDLYWVDIRHRRGRPTPAVVPLIIEVSVTSLEYDLETKCRLYARDGVTEYWVVDGESEAIYVHREPVDDSYATVQVYKHPKQPTPLCSPDAKLDLNWLFRS